MCDARQWFAKDSVTAEPIIKSGIHLYNPVALEDDEDMIRPSKNIFTFMMVWRHATELGVYNIMSIGPSEMVNLAATKLGKCTMDADKTSRIKNKSAITSFLPPKYVAFVYNAAFMKIIQ